MDFVIWKTIFDFIPTYELKFIKCTSLSLWNEFKHYIYYRSASDQCLLTSPDYLLSTTINHSILNHPIIQKIMSYPFLSIAGGFPTSLHLNKTPSTSSDIDIYVLGKTSNHKYIIHQINEFMDWLHEHYNIISIKSIGFGCCVFTIILNNFEYPLQFIFTQYMTLTQVLTSFDNSHNRCGMYQSSFYITPDAKISKETLTTFYYTPVSNKRYKKAIQFGFNIYNLPLETHYMLNEYSDDSTPYQIDISLDNFKHAKIVFQKDWMNGYSTKYQNTHNITLDIKDYHKWKHDIQYVWKGHLLECMIKKSTPINYLDIYCPVTFYYDVTCVGVFESDDQSHIDTSVSEMKYLKDVQLDIMKHAYGLKTLPDEVMLSKDIIGINKYEEQFNLSKELVLNRIVEVNGYNKDTYLYTKRQTIRKMMYDEAYSPYLRLKYIIHEDYNRAFFYYGYSYRDYIHINEEENEAILRINCMGIKKQKINRVYCIPKRSLKYTRHNVDYMFKSWGYWDYEL